MIESLALGPLTFTAPLALLALLGLPVLWFILRATPPQPKTAELPSLALFEDLPHREETPDQTPWWIILLRILIITLAILGLARPVWSPPAPETTQAKGDLLLLIDNDWTSASDWTAKQNAASNILSSVNADRGVYVLPTSTATPEQWLGERLTPQAARARLRAIAPVSWRPDYRLLATALKDFKTDSAETLWVSSGEKSDGFDSLVDQLKAIGSVAIVPSSSSRNMVTIEALSTTSKGPVLSLIRTNADDSQKITLVAYDTNGRSVGSVEGEFSKSAATTDIAFVLPEDVQSNISQFKVLGQPHSGAVWYWSGSSRARRVGLVSVGSSVQPLLTDTYYLKKALAPFSTVFEGTLEELLKEDLGAIMLTDIGRLNTADHDALQKWVSEGGVLIRFAGPRMAAQTDDLIPVTLRRASRAFDSALSWDKPQRLVSFTETGPLATVPLVSDVFVRRQVLAQPSSELPSRTWARLEDGTPLLTATTLGTGRLILFHVTAGPEWSDLPLSGTFVEILRRITLPARELGALEITAEASLAPVFWLDGYGNARGPSADARPLQTGKLSELKPTATYPAGLYEGSAVSFPLNSGAGFIPAPITSWPSGVTITSVAERTGYSIAGLLLALSMLLLFADILVSLILAGKLASFIRSKTVAVLAIGLFGGLVFTSAAPPGFAQDADQAPKSPEAALTLRFAYLQTPDTQLNQLADQGLKGLASILFQRTTVEPEDPVAVNLNDSALDLYPFILMMIPDNGLTLTPEERARLASYLRNGGALIIDTRRGGDVSAGRQIDPRLATLLEGLDLPPLKRAGDDHVLSRSFYLLDAFNGRYPDRPLWIEGDTQTENDARRGDGISTIFITDADMASAWAINDKNRPVFSVEGGERNREMAYRTGVNIVMYILTGNYKDDQVHLPSLLERLGDVTDTMSDTRKQLQDLFKEGTE